MTIEEKAKAYDEALEIAKGLYAKDAPDSLHLERMFPALAESEDEKIRKEIIAFLDDVWHLGKNANFDKWCKADCADWIAWLEKPIDKVEPKFKVGDWIVRDKTIAQILDIQEQYYVGLDINGNDFTSSRFLSDDKIHLWTIQDAKDGDMLCCESGWTCIFKKLNHNSFGGLLFDSYCFIDRTGWFCDGAEGHTLDERINGRIYPATKEQRDTLIKAMADAGYTFDFKKKELKKIEQRPAWSEEDEEIVEALNNYIKNLDIFFSEIKIGDKDILSKEFREKVQPWLKSLKDRVQLKREWSEEDEQYLKDTLTLLEGNRSIHTYGEVKKWLKFLKERYSWKPSKEQMKVLKLSTYCPSEQMSKVLFELYQDLMKLRE